MKLSPDQVEFQDHVRSFFQERITSEYLRGWVAANKRGDAALLASLGELGVEEGFVGATAVFSTEELGILASECGRALLPYALSERLLADGVLPSLMTPSERSRFETEFKAERSTVAPNHCCALSLHEGADRVDGHINWCAGCDDVGRVVAFADTKHGRRCVVFRVSETGVRVAPIESLDRTQGLSRVECASVPALVLSAETSQALEDALEAIKACEAAGICDRVIQMSVEYAKTREQFGKPIGSFQAIQQKLADAYASSEALSSLSRFAVWACCHAPDQRHLTARAAISMAADVAPKICETAIQCHGGIGFTWEYDLHLYLRRAKTLQAAFALDEARIGDLLTTASR
jgi:acyl-CoA dehydrogenase